MAFYENQRFISYYVHDSAPVNPILGQVNTVNILPPYLTSILIESFQSCVIYFTSDLFPSGFQPKKMLCISYNFYVLYSLHNLHWLLIRGIKPMQWDEKYFFLFPCTFKMFSSVISSNPATFKCRMAFAQDSKNQ